MQDDDDEAEDSGVSNDENDPAAGNVQRGPVRASSGPAPQGIAEDDDDGELAPMASVAYALEEPVRKAVARSRCCNLWCICCKQGRMLAADSLWTYVQQFTLCMSLMAPFELA